MEEDSYVPSLGEIIEDLKTKPIVIRGHVNIIAVNERHRKELQSIKDNNQNNNKDYED